MLINGMVLDGDSLDVFRYQHALVTRGMYTIVDDCTAISCP